LSEKYAREFSEILPVLQENISLRQEVAELIENEPMPGKATEGGACIECLKIVLQDLVAGKISLREAYERTEMELPRHSSVHGANNRVFASGWAERLVRTQVSCLYNQAVLKRIVERGEVRCYVEHSGEEEAMNPCSQIAGEHHDARELYERLLNRYRRGDWSQKEVLIPNHPHCTHAVMPEQSSTRG
jgi:hypothetical protein